MLRNLPTGINNMHCITEALCPASLDSGILTLESGLCIDLGQVVAVLSAQISRRAPSSNDAEHEALNEAKDAMTSALRLLNGEDPLAGSANNPASLNDSQRLALSTYCDGEFAHLADSQTESELQRALGDCGDGLLRFLIVELSSQEGCEDMGDAHSRVDRARSELAQVADALRWKSAE